MAIQNKAIQCPICKTLLVPKCPFYSTCMYRLGELGKESLCVRKPTECTFFHQQGGRKYLIEDKSNPSRRDNNESK